jgi:hypothetical protein
VSVIGSLLMKEVPLSRQATVEPIGVEAEAAA